jgi:hypothetical protein
MPRPVPTASALPPDISPISPIYRDGPISDIHGRKFYLAQGPGEEIKQTFMFLIFRVTAETVPFFLVKIYFKISKSVQFCAAAQ